jgi:hypothetical protein
MTGSDPKRLHWMGELLEIRVAWDEGGSPTTLRAGWVAGASKQFLVDAHRSNAPSWPSKSSGSCAGAGRCASPPHFPGQGMIGTAVTELAGEPSTSFELMAR